MQSIKNAILWHVRAGRSADTVLAVNGNMLKRLSNQMCTSTGTDTDQITSRVIGLVKKFDKIDASKVNNVF